MVEIAEQMVELRFLLAMIMFTLRVDKVFTWTQLMDQLSSITMSIPLLDMLMVIRSLVSTRCLSHLDGRFFPRRTVALGYARVRRIQWFYGCAVGVDRQIEQWRFISY